MSDTTAVPALGKDLASSDKSTRDRAVKAVAAFLSDAPRANALSKLDMDKLWKGLFYCVWMSDKPLVQQALSSDVANLLLAIESDDTALRFLRAFWENMVRDWSGIDRLRADKYYMLVRKYLNASLRLLQRGGWNPETCSEYNRILLDRGGPLCPDDNKVPSSLAYHLCDIFLEELEKVMSTTSGAPVPLQTLLWPFFVLAAQARNNKTIERLDSALLRTLFAALRQPCASPRDSPEPRRSKRVRLDEAALAVLKPSYPATLANACLAASAEPAQAIDVGGLRAGLLRHLFDEASKEETRDANRRKIYAFWKAEMDEEEFSVGDERDGS